mgnify:FL=1
MDQNVRNKLNEIRQQQLESEQNLQANEPSTAASDKPLKIAALGGLAAGLIIAWLMYSFLPTENADLIAQRASVAIYENRVREANETIEQLNDRVELLTEKISTLAILDAGASQSAAISNASQELFPITSRALDKLPPPSAGMSDIKTDVKRPHKLSPVQARQGISTTLVTLDNEHFVDNERPVTNVSKHGPWVINLISTPSKADADRFTKKTQSKGIKTEQQLITVKGAQRWRVQITGFSTAENAGYFAETAKAQLGLKDVWIMKR